MDTERGYKFVDGQKRMRKGRRGDLKEKKKKKQALKNCVGEGINQSTGIT